MQDRPTVAAGDIARLAGVGRAAVSNWRRRFQDFPEPVGGTSSNPLFALAEVEAWLRAQGKLEELPEEEKVWQRIRNAADDLRLLPLVGQEAHQLVSRSPETPPDLARLAAGTGMSETIELLYRRYVEAHSRRVQVVSPEVAAHMAGLVGECKTVFDPLCGFGPLLLAATQASQVFGQERDEATALLADARLKARGVATDIRTGDALLADAFPGLEADGALCVPPFNERGWGYEELTNDARWQYGLPPRGESELAWVQHCLAKVRRGGRVVVLMPQAAANRRSGRRIRSQLLRTGTLQAVVALPAGTAPQSSQPPHLWVLRRPEEQDGVPTHLTVAEDTLELGLAVPLVDLLDDEVDLTPSRYLPKASGVEAIDLQQSLAELSGRAIALSGLLPKVRDESRDLSITTVGELARAGAIQIEQTPMRMETESGPVPLLTAKDVVMGGGPTGWGHSRLESVTARAGDIVLPALSRAVIARVINEEVLLGPHLFLLRLDEEILDPAFVAGFLRISAARAASTMSGTYRVDVRRAQLPRLPIADQRSYAEAFRQLESYERELLVLASEGRKLAQWILEGLIDGGLQP
ncbi:N-6 DNA methylase [Nonomuraea sp. NPDC059023]|uniref:N-6 DNA methylase n=1 Tax=unclassified Nonomuraea TaxID=2593643 RepID=UPI00367857D4